MGDDRASVYVREDGITVYRASAIGSCVRALVAARRGEDALPFSDYIDQVLAAGWEYEEAIIQRLESEGWVITGQQDEFELVVQEGLVAVVGHVDGIATSPDGIAHVLEMKSMGPSVFPKWLNKGPRMLKTHLRYGSQATAVMRGMKMPLLYACMERTDLLEPLPVEDRPLYTFVVSEPPILWDAIRRKIVTAETLARVEDEWPECDVGSADKFFCQYRHLHPVEDDLTIIRDEEMGRLFRKAAQAQRIVDMAEAKLKESKKEIRAAMEAMGVTKALASGVQVTLVTTQPTRIDLDRLRADLGEEIERYEYQTSVTQVRLKGGK